MLIIIFVLLRILMFFMHGIMTSHFLYVNCPCNFYIRFYTTCYRSYHILKSVLMLLLAYVLLMVEKLFLLILGLMGDIVILKTDLWLS